MNGLSLRMNGAKNLKTKTTSINAAVLLFPEQNDYSFDYKSVEYQEFLTSQTADMQLITLKNLLKTDQTKPNFTEFLVAVFLEAPTKHPVKCFVTRHITKNEPLQQPFSLSLSKALHSLMMKQRERCTQFNDVVTKLSACVENFPAGAEAVRLVEKTVAMYLNESLKCCISTLRSSNVLSPTKKNEIFNLAHLTLRLLLYIIQKVSKQRTSLFNLDLMLKEIRASIKYLITDEEVPMDTKSVSGILLLSMMCMEKADHSWINVLSENCSDAYLAELLSSVAGKLTLYSAVVIVVPIEMLEKTSVGDKASALVLVRRIMEVAESSLSDATITLGAARTVLQIAKSLNKILEHSLGLQIMDPILAYIWSHLEHYMDSVRHLTAQTLTCIVRYCNKLNNEGKPEALSNLFTALTHLDSRRKSFLISVTSLTSELGACFVLDRTSGLVNELLQALSLQAVHASATIALETLLNSHIRQTNAGTIYSTWVTPILALVSGSSVETNVLSVLEGLLIKIIKIDGALDMILPHIKRSTKDQSVFAVNLKCVLMLLGVVRKSNVSIAASVQSEEEWEGLIGYDVLEQATIDDDDETKTLVLSLVVESRRSTERIPAGAWRTVLLFLRYNINAQSPHFRHLTLSQLKKFIKRVEDSYKVLSRQSKPNSDRNEGEYYLKFFEELRDLCFDSLLPGANYSRRLVALQTLVWCEQIHLDGYDRIWTEDYVDKLLRHLQDSYEGNKEFSLEILCKCPTGLIMAKKYTTSIEIDDVLRQASSLNPSDCVSAAYKLLLLKRKLPHWVLQGKNDLPPDPACYCLMELTLNRLVSELEVAESDLLMAACVAPMYGLLHCMCRLVKEIDVEAISSDLKWKSLIERVISACLRSLQAAGPIVNSCSPEGHLPSDQTHLDEGMGCIKLEDGTQVTSQMVLLCAWRSVKEVSLLLGEAASRLTVSSEGASGTLEETTLTMLGHRFVTLLTETKHRGAFEQAYVGFCMLLTRLWRSPSANLHSQPRAWLGDIMALDGERAAELCPSRRSAGLPYIIQALVTTELQVSSSVSTFVGCTRTLLQLARAGADRSARTHALNILRALFRHSALGDAAGVCVGEAVECAIDGFDADNWMERNSSTLLFSALVVRVFGVQRGRDSTQLCARNKMTGRIFFLRYPRLYDYMLDKLQTGTDLGTELCPAVFPVLLLLARLYPSSLEGSVSSLKLATFIPFLLRCSGSPDLQVRRLAARATPALLPLGEYLPLVIKIVKILGDRRISRNYCHGLLLQVIQLLNHKPESVMIDQRTTETLSSSLEDTSWILEQATNQVPCYLLADEYTKVINLLMWRFPSLINMPMLITIETVLQKLLFDQKPAITNTGRAVCLSNALYLNIIIHNTRNKENVTELIQKSLLHNTYEVVLSALNYLHILYEKEDTENAPQFQEHLKSISDMNTVLNQLRNSEYLNNLSYILKNNKYLECRQKALTVLSLEKNTQNIIIGNSNVTDDEIVFGLLDFIGTAHQNLIHIYLKSLLDFVFDKLRSLSIRSLLEVVRVVYRLSSSGNTESTREVCVVFLKRALDILEGLEDRFQDEERFAVRCLSLGAAARLRCDECDWLRRHAPSPLLRVPPPACLLALAIMDFGPVAQREQGGVFEASEQDNTFLEETFWARTCAQRIQQSGHCPTVVDILNNPVYRSTFIEMGNRNFYVFEDKFLRKNKLILKDDEIHPKIEIIINILR